MQLETLISNPHRHALFLPNQTHHHHLLCSPPTLTYFNPKFSLTAFTAATTTTTTTSCFCSCIPTKAEAQTQELPASITTTSSSSLSSSSSSGSVRSLIRSKMAVAVDPCVLWTFFASLLGFLLLFVLRRGTKDNAGVKGKTNEKKLLEDQAKSSPGGDFRAGTGSGTDVIIVGAGVAGSALAHTLAKV